MAELKTRAAQAATAGDTSCGEAFVAAAESALATGKPDAVPDEELQRVLTAALRLYAAKVDLSDSAVSPVVPDQLTPTDVVVSVTAIVRAAGLNLWDLSMWFQRPPS
jgi:hypothetical protein